MKPANSNILTINGGSSSIKFALYEAVKPLKRGLYGTVDRIGLSGTNLTFTEPTKKQQQQPQTRRRRSQISGEFPDRLARKAN